MTSTLIQSIVRSWMEGARAEPDAIGRKNPDVVFRNALEAALLNYSRRRGDCFDVACGEFLEDDGEYYAVAAKPASTKHRKEITQYDAVMRLAGKEARRVPKNTHEWRALRLALYPEFIIHKEEEEDER